MIGKTAPKVENKAVIKSLQHANLIKIKTFGNQRLDGWENILIYGDNLIALEFLCENLLIKGNVRLIYIDPPFSTKQIFRSGNGRTATISKRNDDIEAYADLLVGKEFLEFLRKRFVFLKHLLANDGTIYTHIGCKVGHYVKVLMDEIFGEERFISDITRIKCNPKNFERRAYGNIKDMILFYSKTEDYIWNDSREKFTEDDIKRLFPKIEKNGRRYTTTPLHAPGETKNGTTGQKWMALFPPEGRHWRYPPKKLEKLDKAGLIEWSLSGNPRKKIYADEILDKGKKRQDIWKFNDNPYPSYPTEKNIDMLKMIIETSSNPDDIILDCFAGSGTTLLAAEETGRRWIGIDNSKVAIETTKERFSLLNNISSFGLFQIKDGTKY